MLPRASFCRSATVVRSSSIHPSNPHNSQLSRPIASPNRAPKAQASHHPLPRSEVATGAIRFDAVRRATLPSSAAQCEEPTAVKSERGACHRRHCTTNQPILHTIAQPQQAHPPPAPPPFQRRRGLVCQVGLGVDPVIAFSPPSPLKKNGFAAHWGEEWATSCPGAAAHLSPSSPQHHHLGGIYLVPEI